MTKASIELQDLRRRLYVKAKAEPSWRFWGLYVHVCKMETLRAAYAMAKQNDGAPGIDGVTFEATEAQGVEALLDRRLDAARAAEPTKRRQEALERELTRIRKSMERLLTAYQEDLLSLDELRRRMPELRAREQSMQAERQAILDQTADQI